MNFCKSSVRSGSNRLLGLAVGALAIAPAALVASLANASAYPPNYVIEAECKDVGPATVCAENRRYGRWPRLSIRYKGQLQSSQWGRLSVYVSLNGRAGTFALTNANYVDFVSIGGPRNVIMCVDATSPSVGMPYPACRNQSSNYNWEEPSQAETDLFFYARDVTGQANAWDVAFAFVGENGTWDSNMGQNYTARFE